MERIRFDGGAIEVDAADVASSLGLSPDALRAVMRAGEITTRVERGADADAGRWRLTFFAPGRRLRLVVDDAGRVLTTSIADHVRRAPQAAVKAGSEEGVASDEWPSTLGPSQDD